MMMSYHQKVIKEEDLSLVHSCPLRSVRIRHLIELAATHQPTVGKGQHLRKHILRVQNTIRSLYHERHKWI